MYVLLLELKAHLLTCYCQIAGIILQDALDQATALGVVSDFSLGMESDQWPSMYKKLLVGLKSGKVSQIKNILHLITATSDGELVALRDTVEPVLAASPLFPGVVSSLRV